MAAQHFEEESGSLLVNRSAAPEAIRLLPETTALQLKIQDTSARIGVVGMGYVGLPTMVALAQKGFQVTGIDIDEDRVHKINEGKSYVEDVPEAVLVPLVESKKINATTDYSIFQNLEVVLVCVPTPLTGDKEPDLAPLDSAIQELASNLRPGHMVVLQSTSFPGTTEEYVLPILEKTGYKVGKDFFLAFALERVDPGNQENVVQNVPKVVAGVTPQCTELAVSFLSTFVADVVAVSSPKVAEMTKLLENTFRSVNIALVNELAMLCQRMDIDIWEVIEAASTKPFGFMPFYPGPGVGGHCIPIDPFYLSWKAKEYDFEVNFVRLAAEINDNMPAYTVCRIEQALRTLGKSLGTAHLLVLGVSFKENINDTRNSPATHVIKLLIDGGATVVYSDSHVPELNINGQEIPGIELEPKKLSQFDAVVILAGHSYYDWDQIVDGTCLVIDTKNATRSLGFRPNVVKL